jgi:hypothetical protein
MTPDPGKSLEKALKLSPAAREALPGSLLESQAEEIDEGVEAARAEAISEAVVQPRYKGLFRATEIARARSRT